MTNKDDSKPFVMLRESADDFAISFDADIKTCLSLLDSKISALISNPDHMESPSRDGTRLNAHLEFSKAKLDIFLKVKYLVKEMEENWIDQLNNIVSNFLENVEILLAKTNLETSSQSGSKKSSALSQNRKSSVQASYLLNTAKRIPVLNSFLSRDDDDDEEEEMEQDDAEMHISKNSSLNISVKEDAKSYKIPPMLNDKTSTEHLFRKVFEEMKEDDQDDESSEEDNEAQVPVTPSKTNTTPLKRTSVRAVKEVAVKPSPRKTNEVIPERSASRRSAVTRNAISREPVKTTPQKKNAAKGRKSILKVDPANDIELHATPSRSTRKRTANKETSQTGNNNDEEMLESSENDYEIAAPKTPKNVHFSMGLDVTEDLEIYSPEVKLTRSAPRRKTVMIPEIPDVSSDFNLTPNVSRSKRKTIGSSAMDVSVAPSPKRFKRGSRASSATPVISEEPEEDSDHLESDESTTAEHYTPWLPLDDIDGKLPAQAGIYELKVYKAKKSAYIGSCDNLRHKLTLHKLGQNSGHKHLDKFLDRNRKDIQVRYEKIATAAQAKNEEMNRIKAFVAQHKTTPAYN